MPPSSTIDGFTTGTRARTGPFGLALLAIGLGQPTGSAVAAPPTLQTANMSPAVQIYGLPRQTRRPDPATAQIRLGLDWASHAVSDRADGASVRFDGETRRYTLRAGGPLSLGAVGWWALAVPWVSHSRGVLDGPIEGWHQALGLPQGDRPERPWNKLRFRVTDSSGQDSLLRTEATAGPGDLALSAGLPLHPGAKSRYRVDAGFRLEAPTGDPDRLLGSGGWDLATWLAAEGTLGLGGGWSWHAAAGGMYMTDSQILAQRHRNRALFARAAVHWQWLEGLSLAAQMDGHSAMYRSPLTPLGRDALELRLGATWEPRASLRAKAGFSEDLAVGAAPDITFHLNLSRRLGQP